MATTETPTMDALTNNNEGLPLASPDVAGVPATLTKKKVTKKTSAKKQLDPIIQSAQEIENFNKAEALAHGQKVQADTDFNLFKIGGILAVIRANGWYTEYDTFQKFVETEFSTLSSSPYRKARYLMAIYNDLVESGVKWEQVGDLGWTKLTVISSKLTPENVEEWVERAKKMTVINLQQYVKDMMYAYGIGKDEGGLESEPPTPSDLTSLSFKVHPDQKDNAKNALDKAKKEFGTEFDAVALDHIMMGFVTGQLGKAKKALTLQDQMLVLGPEAVLEVFGQVFPHISLSAEEMYEQTNFEDITKALNAKAKETSQEEEPTMAVGSEEEDNVLYEEEV